MGEEALDELESALRADRSLTHLLHALALGEGFQFHILVCETPQVAQAALRVLAGDAAALRGNPVSLVQLNPYSGRRGISEPVSFEILSRLVLEPLLALSAAADSSTPVVVIDASQAVERDEAAWRLLFRRMNERRNVIAQQFPGSLILSVPASLEVAFAHEASDFWSIRSTAVTVSPVRLAARQPALEPERRPAEKIERPVWVEAAPSRLQAAVEEARRRVATAPKDPAARHALSIQLSRLGVHEEEWGTLDRALAAYQESLDILRWLLRHDPERPLWLRDILRVVRWVLRLAPERTLGARDILQVVRRLLRLDHDRPEWLRDLSVSLNNVGDVHESRGDLDRALAAYDESLQIGRRLLERDPDRPEWLRDFTLILDRVADVWERRGELNRALEVHEESLEVKRRLSRRDPGRTEWLDGVLTTQGKIEVLRSRLKGVDG